MIEFSLADVDWISSFRVIICTPYQMNQNELDSRWRIVFLCTIKIEPMPQIISSGGELVRINAAKNIIERSINGGVSWTPRYTGTAAGTFRDLLTFGGELLACTSKGIYYSTNGGVSWAPRCTTSSAGDFLSLASDGTKLLATTSKGLYTSTNKGVSWVRR